MSTFYMVNFKIKIRVVKMLSQKKNVNGAIFNTTATTQYSTEYVKFILQSFLTYMCMYASEIDFSTLFRIFNKMLLKFLSTF